MVDLHMPVMDGHEFLRVARSYHAFETLPFVVISSKLAVDLQTFQPARFLEKPFAIEQLVEAIEAATVAEQSGRA